MFIGCNKTFIIPHIKHTLCNNALQALSGIGTVVQVILYYNTLHWVFYCVYSKYVYNEYSYNNRT